MSGPLGMEPMRPVDHVEVLPPNGFWFRSTGWKDWILQALFTGLVGTGAVVEVAIDPGWWAWWSQGLVIVVVMLAANAILKRFVSR